jgi:protein SCO1
MGVKPKGVIYTVMALVAVMALFTGVFVYQHTHREKQINISEFHGTYLEHPRTVNQFSLQGTDEKPFDNSSLTGEWTLVFFGFTNCGYLCPTTMAELGKMYRILEEKNIKKLPKIVMISIDPERDDITKLGKYVTAFHPNFYGARGEEESIRAMTHEMGIAYTRVANKDASQEASYDVQHSGAVILFNPQGELNAFFTSPHHAELLAKDYIMLVS